MILVFYLLLSFSLSPLGEGGHENKSFLPPLNNRCHTLNLVQMSLILSEETSEQLQQAMHICLLLHLF